MTYGIPITWHHRSSWKIRACSEGNVLQGISSPQTKKKPNSVWTERTKRPFTGNKHPPTTAWSPWTMQVINNSFNTQKVPVLLRKTTWGKWERRSEGNAFWEFNFTSVMLVRHLRKHPCLRLVWAGQHEATALLLTWVFLRFDAACPWYEGITQVVPQLWLHAMLWLCTVQRSVRTQHKVFSVLCQQLATSGPHLTAYFAASDTEMLNLIVEHKFQH